jgi:hypothetical protein
MKKRSAFLLFPRELRFRIHDDEILFVIRRHYPVQVMRVFSQADSIRDLVISW